MRSSRLQRLERPQNRHLSFLGCQVAYFIVCRRFLLTYGVVYSMKSLLRDGLGTVLQAVQ